MHDWSGIPLILSILTVGPVQFDRPIWLWLLPISWAIILWLGRKSLSGLGTWSRRVALAVRLIVVLLLVSAVAEPQWRRQAKDVAVTAILDASKSVPQSRQAAAEAYVEETAVTHRRPEDRLGLVTAAQDAYVQTLPSKRTSRVEKQHIGSADGTNLAGAGRLALAVKPEDAAYRILIISDGNETTGSLLQLAQSAKAAGVPIDVLPIRYTYESEVIVDRVVAPLTSRMGENINVKVMLESTAKTRGLLSLLMNGEPVDLDPETEGVGMLVELDPGTNGFQVPVTIARAGPQQFEAVFSPLPGAEPGDVVIENNRQTAVTFASSEGKVLVFAEDARDAAALVEALRQSRIEAEVVTASGGPESLTELNAYDAVVLINEPAFNFSLKQQEEFRQYVHDGGGGLVMIGGPQAYGAGGWIGSPTEDALPVRLDPPQKRQRPRGALVMVMHSIEMPQGVYYGKECCRAAVNTLSRLDMAGIIEWGGRGMSDTEWVHELSEVGDKKGIFRAIENLTFGDMPDMAPSLVKALEGLKKVEAGVKAVIVISDGDPSLPTAALLQDYKDNGITISTVCVNPHSPQDSARLYWIAQQTNGKFFDVTNAQVATVPQIFTIIANDVKRPLIWEGDAFQPGVTGAPSEPMRGIGAVPAIGGYVITADREGKSIVTLRGKENDPILAHWQYGLGKSVAFMSDAAPRWGPGWVGWGGYRAFWEQHVRWAMRPSGSANVRVSSVPDGEKTRLIVNALDPSGDPLNFATFRGRVATPDGKGLDVEFRQRGPGEYEAEVATALPGSYMISMRYLAPGADGGDPIEGSAQAAITRPYADEFRALQDNAPLLQQVASMTGGRVLTGDAAADDLWSREGLRMPVALTPIWLVVALTAIGLFLVDVGVRRVRIDLPMIAGAIRKLAARGRHKAGGQMETLRAAREKAREKIAERSEAGPPGAPPMPSPSATTAKVKFEAAPEALAKKPRGPVLEGEGEDLKAAPRTEPPKPGVPEEEGMSRLMRAKKRAQDEMGEET